MGYHNDFMLYYMMILPIIWLPTITQLVIYFINRQDEEEDDEDEYEEVPQKLVRKKFIRNKFANKGKLI